MKAIKTAAVIAAAAALGMAVTADAAPRQHTGSEFSMVLQNANSAFSLSSTKTQPLPPKEGEKRPHPSDRPEKWKNRDGKHPHPSDRPNGEMRKKRPDGKKRPHPSDMPEKWRKRDGKHPRPSDRPDGEMREKRPDGKKRPHPSDHPAPSEARTIRPIPPAK